MTVVERDGSVRHVTPSPRMSPGDRVANGAPVSTHAADADAVGVADVRVRAFVVWLVAFALGVLYHEWQAGPELLSVHTAAGIGAIVLLLRPTSLHRLLVLFALIVVELIVNLPEPLNHDVLLAGGAAGALLDRAWLRVRGTADDGAAFFFGRVAPMLRVAFIVMWFAAAFAKINRGFLSADTSCALWIVDSVPLLDTGAFPQAVRALIVGGTVLTEFSIPVLLLMRRTRLVGVALGWMFHFIAAFAGHTAFSGVGWSMYLLFLPVATLAAIADVGVERWRGVATTARERLERAWRHPATLPLLVCVWLLAVVALQQLPVVWLNRARRYGAMLPYVMLAPVWAWLVWQGVRRRAGADDGGAVSLRLRHPVAFLVVGLVLVNALTPYVGLKTRYSFTMYSNIRTEADLWNHFLVPSAVRVTELEDDLIRVTRVTGVGEDEDVAAILGAQVPTGEARRVLAPHPDATVVYEMDGRRHVAEPVASDAAVGTPLPLGTAKLAGFRPVEPIDVCQH